MIFKRKPKQADIFSDLPKVTEVREAVKADTRKRGRRAMLIPDAPYNDDPAADLLLANTGKQKEQWLSIIFESEVREAKQLAIAAFLQNNYRVQKWWANSIALMYLKWRVQAKNTSSEDNLLRLTVEVPTTVGLCYNLFNSTSLYGESFRRFLKLVQDEKLVISFSDNTRATISFVLSEYGCSVIVEHEFLDTAAARKEKSKYWQQIFQELVSQVSR